MALIVATTAVKIVNSLIMKAMVNLAQEVH
jgi:hypothetical protein